MRSTSPSVVAFSGSHPAVRMSRIDRCCLPSIIRLLEAKMADLVAV